jgi:lipopolysaccharide/colanic/teichoic acid biosynthesis glycosyltransferase
MPEMAGKAVDLRDATGLAIARFPDRGGWRHHATARSSPQRLVKRLLDLVGALGLLLFLMPLFFMLMVILRSQGGPVFYAHRRVGRYGKEFGCLKFRTMVVDADAVLADLLLRDATASAEWQATRKLRRDPRVTRLGYLLRVTSIDELPQLINVLTGDMSLVGPRPVTRAEIEELYGEHAAETLTVRPGLTGPWQISGRNETSYAERVALDLDYASNLSLRTDLGILLKTVRVVLQRTGAH